MVSHELPSAIEDDELSATSRVKYIKLVKIILAKGPPLHLNALLECSDARKSLGKVWILEAKRCPPRA